MRPVDRGAAPAVYARYQEAAADLQARLGDFCSYCERQIETHLAVEHIRPKSLNAALENEWTNFLLGCANCNSSKGDMAVNLVDFLWPDTDNTLRAFAYSRGGLLAVDPAITQEVAAKAIATIALLGLDKYPGNAGREPTSADKRWLRRQEAWQKAQKCHAELQQHDTPEFRQIIVDLAITGGLFSIWWTVFNGDIDMRRRLREAFIGTANLCFNADENLIARGGGQL